MQELPLVGAPPTHSVPGHGLSQQMLHPLRSGHRMPPRDTPNDHVQPLGRDPRCTHEAWEQDLPMNIGAAALMSTQLLLK